MRLTSGVGFSVVSEQSPVGVEWRRTAPSDVVMQVWERACNRGIAGSSCAVPSSSGTGTLAQLTRIIWSLTRSLRRRIAHRFVPVVSPRLSSDSTARSCSSTSSGPCIDMVAPELHRLIGRGEMMPSLRRLLARIVRFVLVRCPHPTLSGCP
jgi:hypothetical protein